MNCNRCHAPVEYDPFFDDYPEVCDRCADKLIEQTNKQQEWEHYHPGTPMPESEK
jgi:hypothetical protein